MKRITFFLLAFVLFGCRHDSNETQLNLDYLDKEISNRVGVLSKDSLFSNELNTINKDVDNLKYLTLDIENINASIIKSNRYFYEVSKLYNVDTSGFVVLYKGVPLYEIVNMIKKNHLSLLNKIIIQRNKNGSLMYTAQ